jgi:hypothetical protein
MSVQTTDVRKSFYFLLFVVEIMQKKQNYTIGSLVAE